MAKLRVGIAGYGVVGRRRREVIDRHPNLETVAICDRVMGGEGLFQDGVRYYTTPHQLLTEELDILFVCLTNDMAADVTIAGLKRGLHVFCEKPPGRDVADIRRVRTVEEMYPDLSLMYGFNHRYHDSVQDALQMIGTGDLGQLLNMRGVYGKSKIINFQSDWRTKREVAGGGILLDQGIHMVDLMRLFAGSEFEEIHGFISNAHWGHSVEDNAYALMRSSEGVVAMLHSTATQWRHRFHLDMAFENGGLILAGLLTGSKSYGKETLTIVWKSNDDAGDPKEHEIRYNADPSWEREVNVFAEAVLKGRAISNGSSLDALKTMQMVYRIYCADPTWRDQFGLTTGMDD